MRAIADYIDIDGFYYLDKLEPYANLLLSERALLNYLQSNTLASLQKTLQQWQQGRYVAFSFPKKGRVLPSTLHADHALAAWMLNSPNLKHSYSHENNNTPQYALEKIQNYAAALITQPKKLKKGLIYSGGSLAVIQLAPHPIIGFAFCTILAYKGTALLNAAINYERYIPALQKHGETVLLLGILVLFFGGVFTGIGINVLCLCYFIYKTLPKQSANHGTLPKRVTATASEVRYLEDNTKHKDSLSRNTLKKTTHADAIQTQAEPQKNDDLPLDINRHGYHLAILLSEAPTQNLAELIESANILYSHIDYLQTSHPYLATRVQEFIKDLTHNTLVRLDEMASRFVTQGQVAAEAKALFVAQHEARIDALLTLNLSQINDLNQTILEKQMAGFTQVGSQLERDFRDALIELKILLRWLIVQQPDAIQASSHQVILDNLESSTLADMQTIFFEPQTTSEQRGELQQQLAQLLAHFKQQTTQTVPLYGDEQDDLALQDLLQLSQPEAKGVSVTTTDIDTANSQAQKQQFIDFNQQYIEQIRTHWH